MIHSGSRNFGFKTANLYHHQARKLCERWREDLPDMDLAYLPLDSIEGREYFTAMNYCLDFARANREHMMRNVTDVLISLTGAKVLEMVNIHHNYAALETHYGREVLVHRKGAIRASAGLAGIIPGSMGQKSFITEGLGNPESFESSSHGAGRRMGRNEATRTLDLAAEQKKMAGIVHGMRSKKDLDEAPGAYKNIDQVMNDQKDLVKVRVTLQPLGVIKG
jgi:tRNA-splicing ligase RtcB